jgi:antitoxin (DNA-binding transcriptional repressor) of toxin-antitoxin stability system
VSLVFVKSVTSKMLHEQTGQCLDLVKQGQQLYVLRNGKPDALLVPVTESVDPSWDEIMAEVRAARTAARTKGIPTRPNPILAGRKKRSSAARLKSNARLR